jgi:hypothetical protein
MRRQQRAVNTVCGMHMLYMSVACHSVCRWPARGYFLPCQCARAEAFFRDVLSATSVRALSCIITQQRVERLMTVRLLLSESIHGGLGSRCPSVGCPLCNSGHELHWQAAST